MNHISISSLRESRDFIRLIYAYPDMRYPWKVKKDFKLKYKSREHLANLAVKCDWLTIEKQNQLLPTSKGITLINETNEKSAFRNQLFDIVNECRPVWASHLKNGRTESVEFLPEPIKDIFITVGLYNPEDDQYDRDAIEWWDKLASAYYASRDEYLTKIGRIGEELTMRFEEKRTNNKPKWKSLESDKLGYDILSKVSKKDMSLLSIEVKTSISSNTFTFTRNEKNLLDKKASKNYKIYFWRIYNEQSAELTVLAK